MLPNIDSIQVGAHGSSQPVRPENDLVVNKTAESYRHAAENADNAEVTEKGAKVAQSQPAATTEPRRSATDTYLRQDEIQLNFRVTPEERDALTSAFSGPDGVASLTKEEKTTLKGVAERVNKLVEDALSRSGGREKTEKALSEWYSRLSQGQQPPEDLLSLLRQAAMGAFDEMYR